MKHSSENIFQNIKGRYFELKEVEKKLKKDTYKIRYEEEWETEELNGWCKDAHKMGGEEAAVEKS